MPGSVLLCHAGLHPAMQFVCKHLLMTLIDDVLGHVCHFQGVWGLLGVSRGGWGDGRVHFALSDQRWSGLVWPVLVCASHAFDDGFGEMQEVFLETGRDKSFCKKLFFCKNKSYIGYHSYIFFIHILK